MATTETIRDVVGTSSGSEMHGGSRGDRRAARSPRRFLQVVDFLLDLRNPNQLEMLFGLQALNFCGGPLECHSEVVVRGLDGGQAGASILSLASVAGPSAFGRHTSTLRLICDVVVTLARHLLLATIHASRVTIAGVECLCRRTRSSLRAWRG